MKSDNKTVSVVSGGAGFLGSHLCEALLAKGHRVIAIDNLSTGSSKNLANILFTEKDFQFIHGDITKAISIKEEVNFIYNLASPASPKDYQKLSVETLRAGAYGTENLLQLAEDNSASFLQASTSEIYGDPLISPQTESYWGNVNPVGARSMYDEAKRYGEALVMAHHRQYKTDTKIARIFNTYGTRMKSDDGRAIPTFLAQALQDKDITVFGDGTQTRSFCYVGDCIAGLIALMESSYHSPINIGNPTEHSLQEVAEKVIDATNSSSQIVYLDLPEDDPKTRKPDISKAKKILNWEPKIDLERGLKIVLHQSNYQDLIY